MEDIFEYEGYKEYLKAQLGDSKKRTGRRAALAGALNCQTSFVSRVLNTSSVHLSFEQAFKANQFLQHTDLEQDYFLLMVQQAKSGSVELSNYYEKKRQIMKEDHLSLKNRVQTNREIPKEKESRYFSSWQYAAIHMLASIPKYSRRQEMADYLGLNPSRVAEILDFLTDCGLLVAEGRHYTISPTHIHIDQRSDEIVKHHMNWRLKALSSIESRNPEQLHYSVLMTMSQKDRIKLKNRMIKMIRANLDDIKESEDEVLCCVGLDFFELVNGS